MRRLTVAAATLVAVAAAGAPTLAQAPFTALFGAAGEGACYTRSYDAAHLAAHPRQRVTSIAIAYRPITQMKQKSTPQRFEVGLGLRVKGDGELYSRVAYCQPAGAGFSCGLESDGGQITLTTNGARGLRLTTGRISIEGNRRFIEVGGAQSDDSTFMMQSAPDSACAALRRALR